MNDALLAPYGFFAQYTPGCAFPELLTTDLGKAFFAEEYFKPYPFCAANHQSIECALSLRRAYGLQARDIDRILVRVQPPTLRVFRRPVGARPGQLQPAVRRVQRREGIPAPGPASFDGCSDHLIDSDHHCLALGRQDMQIAHEDAPVKPAVRSLRRGGLDH
jgi:hypothetical protein